MEISGTICLRITGEVSHLEGRGFLGSDTKNRPKEEGTKGKKGGFSHKVRLFTI